MKNRKSYNQLTKALILIICLLSFLQTEAQVILATDFTSDTDKKAPLHEIWDVANRISPTNGSNVRSGTGINLVRMIGGIVKKVNGVKIPDYDYDPVPFNSNVIRSIFATDNRKSIKITIDCTGVFVFYEQTQYK